MINFIQIKTEDIRILMKPIRIDNQAWNSFSSDLKARSKDSNGLSFGVLIGQVMTLKTHVFEL